jgi:hypothetical protein
MLGFASSPQPMRFFAKNPIVSLNVIFFYQPLSNLPPFDCLFSGSLTTMGAAGTREK